MNPPPARLRIALLSPKGPLYRHRTGIFGKGLRGAPLTLTTLAALVPAELNAEIKIYDEGVQVIPLDLQADIIGMTVITGSSKRAYELSRHFRSRGIPVVLGGPHITLIPEDAQSHADSIVIGYAEETWPQLLRDFVRGDLKPEYRMSKDFALDKPAVLPFPRRDLLKQSGYKMLNTFEATRGCIHHCDFCVVPNAWGSRPWQKPIAHVVDDIKRTGAKRLAFYDLNLISDFQYAKELFRALIPLKVKWFGLSTVLIGKDPELMELAAKSGCACLLIGLEAVSTDSLAEYRKGFNVPVNYGELIRSLHALGISVNGTFVFGADGDTTESFDAVRDFVIEHKVDVPRFAILTPFPGTPLHRRLAAEGRILTRDWTLYDCQHVVFQPKQLTVEQLQQGHERVWNEVFSYAGICKRMRLKAAQLPLLLGANFAYRYYARNLSRFYNCLAGVA